MTKRIMVIDDSELVLDWVRKNLSPFGFDVTIANSPFDTQSMVQLVQPDLILLDVGMPGLSGDMLCRMLKQNERYQDTTIVLYSSLNEEELRQLAADSQADGYIQKTDDIGELARRISEVLKAEADSGGKQLDTSRPVKITVVDDSPVALMWVQQNLESIGYEVKTWDSPIGAQELVEEHNPDAILLDVRMPIQTGDKLCMMLKRNPKTQGIPIILYSDIPEFELQHLAQTSQADGYIVKTHDPESLTERIAEVLQKVKDSKHSS